MKTILEKMFVKSGKTVSYSLKTPTGQIELNSLIGQKIQLTLTGHIQCMNCSKTIKKGYAGGYCYPCSQKLPQCDLCIVKPELCHFAKGTCRDPEWGERNCNQDHIIYLSLSSHVKVGITRKGQIPTRWMDQGAVAALGLFKVPTRHLSGILEKKIGKFFSDKTHWMKLLQHVEPRSLEEEKEHVLSACEAELDDFIMAYGEEALEELEEGTQFFTYPVEKYPEKIKSAKNKSLNGKLLGIKGQYLLFEEGVFNVRNHTGSECILEY